MTCCLRGLAKKDWVKDGVVLSSAFVPDNRTEVERSNAGKQPGCEISVNWEIDPTVEALTLRQQTAVHGAARIQTSHLEYLRKLPMVKDVFFWEIDGVPEPFHGNLVFRTEQRGRWALLASSIAIACEIVARP